jgi:hypothetical protein
MALRALAALHDRPSDSALARLLLGRLAMDAGQLDEADAELQHALALARRLDLAPLQADVLHLRGLLRRRQQRPADAIADLEAAVAQVERIRGTLQADRFRAAFLGDRAAMYEDLADCLLEQARVGDRAAAGRAFHVIEQARNRTLLEEMERDLTADAAGDAAAPAMDAAAPLEQLRVARAALNALYSVLHEDTGKDAQRLERWRAQVRMREHEVDEVERRLATTGGVGGAYAAVVTLDEALAMLAPGEALVEYFAVGDALGAMVLGDGRAATFRAIASLADVSARIAAVQFQINRALRPGALDGPRGKRLLGDAQRELAALARLLWTPIESAVKSAERVCIVPHGQLHAAPFAALWLGDHWLIERRTVHTAPSASMLQRLLAAPAGDTGQQSMPTALVVGVADEHAPKIVDEARLVATLLEQAGGSTASLLIDSQATVAAITAAAPQASLLHLACHGRYAPDSPMGSGLRLADRWLTVRDISTLALSARLVTLSGCETGLSRVRPGDELLGLMRSLFAAGAKSVLGSLWRVDDEITREWMTAFYGSLRTVGERTLAQSLRIAHLEVMGRHAHPASWAPFALAGLP